MIEFDILPRLGIQIRNMKMVFNIYGTWRLVMFEKLMMKIYDFFIRLCRLVALYNNMLKIFHLRNDFYILLYRQLNDIAK